MLGNSSTFSKIPASAATPIAKRFLMYSAHTHHHNTIIIPSLIYTPSTTILRHNRAHNSSFCIFDTSFVKDYHDRHLGMGEEEGEEEVGRGVLEGYGDDDICYRQESSSGK
jgi:hypothetical protein